MFVCNVMSTNAAADFLGGETSLLSATLQITLQLVGMQQCLTFLLSFFDLCGCPEPTNKSFHQVINICVLMDVTVVR